MRKGNIFNGGSNCRTQSAFPVDTGRKLNVHKTFRRRPGRLLSVLCTFNLRPVSTGLVGKYWYTVSLRIFSRGCQ